jgi:phosphatidate cytidylyltransferase
MAPRPADEIDPALRKRIVSGILLAGVAVSDVVLGGWFFALFITAMVVLMAVEWRRLVGQVPRPAADLLLVAAAAVPAAAIAAATVGDAELGLAMLLSGTVVGAGVAAHVPGAPIDRVAGGILYLGLPALALVWLRASEMTGVAAVLWLLFVVWATDVFAYFAGRAWGGPRLCPSVSPGKTWAGLIGGVIGAAAIGMGFALVNAGSAMIAAVAAAVLALVAQAGDLFESWLKRRAGLKDAGNLIPGHGGVLDRLDGLLFAAPAFALLIFLIGPGIVP